MKKYNNKKEKERFGEIENELIDEIADMNMVRIKKEMNNITVNNKVNAGKIWKIKKKMCPKAREPPLAKKDDKGSLQKKTR